MRGGTEPTVTDALVVLGYLNPTALLGGRMPIDAATARRAIDQRVAEPLRISRERAAVGIFNVVNANMAAGIRSVSIERGHDPRDFTLVAGGGATSAHAGRLMSELGLKSTIIPRVASGLCAFGEAVADVKHTHLASYTTPLETLEPEKLDAILLELEERGRSELSEEGFVDEQIFFERSLDMKYVDQVHECSVPIPRFTVTRDRVADIAEAFHRRHEALYTYCERDNMPELINVEVNVFGRFPPLAVAGGAVEGSAVPSAIAHRDCFFEEYGDYRRTPVYRGNDLLAGDAVEGPAIVEEETTTIVVFPGLVLSVTTAEAYLMRALTNFG
jgi:N-methylhydantoinase A